MTRRARLLDLATTAAACLVWGIIVLEWRRRERAP